MNAEQKLRLVVKLYDRRDLARRLLGEQFWTVMEVLKKGITKRAAATGKSALQAAIDAAHANPNHTEFILAAFVEMEDPTPRPTPSSALPTPAPAPQGT